MPYPYYFYSLDLLDELAGRVSAVYPSIFSGVRFVCVQHLLETTGSLIESFLKLGARPEDIYLLGKSYSAGSSVFDRLLRLGVTVSVNRTEGSIRGFDPIFDAAVRKQWDRFEKEVVSPESVKKLVVLDDGGHSIAQLPSRVAESFRIVAIEQTANGIQRINRTRNRLQIPVVNVALSAAKKEIEPPFIAETVLLKLRHAIPNEPAKCGVIGIGNIGRALVRKLHRQQHRVFVYDENDEATSSCKDEVTICKSVEEIIRFSDYIFGCSGDDVLRDFVQTLREKPQKVNGEKTFISASSEDIEFRSLLTFIRESRIVSGIVASPLDDVEYMSEGLTIKILKGGFPANFDISGESVPKKDIQMTRALLLGGVLQGVLYTFPAGYIMLDPRVQRFVVKKWLSLNPDRTESYEQSVREGFNRLDWIRHHSEGRYIGCSKIQRLRLT